MFSLCQFYLECSTTCEVNCNNCGVINDDCTCTCTPQYTGVDCSGLYLIITSPLYIYFSLTLCLCLPLSLFFTFSLPRSLSMSLCPSLTASPFLSLYPVPPLSLYLVFTILNPYLGIFININILLIIYRNLWDFSSQLAPNDLTRILTPIDRFGGRSETLPLSPNSLTYKYYVKMISP